MNIQTGLFDHMVLQRDGKNVCDAQFTGICTAAGRVMARVTRRGGVVKGFNGVDAGQTARGTFQGRLRGLPTGGPYDIELRIAGPAGCNLDSLRIRDVLVGDVWILGGQSNMEGIGLIKDAAKPISQVRAFYMDDRWAVAQDPLHNLGEAVDPVHTDLAGGVRIKRDPKIGTGLGVAFGQDMARRTGVPQGLIACAHGGTSMTQWDPAGKKLGSRSLYGAMIRRFRKNGGRVAGVVWYQGCSEAWGEAAKLYTRRMKALVRSMRRDFGDPKMPFAAVQIAAVFLEGSDSTFWNSIQDQQRRLPDAIARCTVVPAIDLGYDDCIHISGKDQQRLGRRLAQAMAVLRGDRQAGLPPITLRKVTMQGSRIMVQFDHVIGQLRAKGRPAGFMLGGTSPGNRIFRIDLQGNIAWINTSLESHTLASTQLYYGYGMAPYCNITDGADRSLPVFGPVPLGIPIVTSDFVKQWLVSRALPSAGKLRDLAYPRNRKALGLTSRTFAGNLADIHLDLFRCAPQDRRVYYACRIDCPERMNLTLGLGYDGPVKVWIDGKPRFQDPKGTNPAGQDKALIPFLASAGEHEILIALASNNGKAWGICLRFSRRASHQQGLQPIAMPKFMM